MPRQANMQNVDPRRAPSVRVERSRAFIALVVACLLACGSVAVAQRGPSAAQSHGSTASAPRPPFDDLALAPRAPVRRLLDTEHKTCLVLSASPGLAFAHVGVIRALQESGVRVDCIVGTGVGAVLGAVYASAPTIPIDESLRPLLREYAAFVAADPATAALPELRFATALTGGMDAEFTAQEAQSTQHLGYLRLVRILADYFSNARLERLSIPLWVIVQEPHRGAELQVHREGDIATIIARSAASAARFSNFDARAQNTGQGLSQLVEPACALYPDARFLISNASGTEYEMSEEMTCPFLIALTTRDDVSADAADDARIAETGYQHAARDFGVGRAGRALYPARSMFVLPNVELVGGSGVVDTQLVRNLISTKRAQFRACHERALETDPRAADSFTLHATVFTDGSISELAISGDTPGLPAVRSCVLQVFSSLHMRAGQANARVELSIPFAFTPDF